MFLQHRELKADQLEAMLDLCKNQMKAELEMHLKYHPQMYDLLEQLLLHSQETQLKKLDEVFPSHSSIHCHFNDTPKFFKLACKQVHEKEVSDLKKKLDAQNRDEMKILAKKHKDKSELARYIFVATL